MSNRIQECYTNIVHTLISDHFAIYANLKIRILDSSNNIKDRSLISRPSLNGNKINELINRTDWSQFNNINKPNNELYNETLKKYTKICKQSEHIKKKNSIRNQSGWMNHEILNLCNERDKLYRR